MSTGALPSKSREGALSEGMVIFLSEHLVFSFLGPALTEPFQSSHFEIGNLNFH